MPSWTYLAGAVIVSAAHVAYWPHLSAHGWLWPVLQPLLFASLSAWFVTLTGVRFAPSVWWLTLWWIAVSYVPVT